MAKAAFSLSPRPALKRHAWAGLLTFSSVLVGASALSFAVSPRLYETSAKFSVGEKDVGISNLGQALTDISTQAPSKAADPIATQAERVQSQKVIQRALELFQQETGVAADQLPAVADVRLAMTVKIVPATSILQVTLRNSDPQVATKLLNAIVQASVDENIEATRSGAATLRKYLESKTPEQRIRLQQAEAAESQYQQTNGIVSLDNQTQSLVTGIAALEDEERKLRAQLQESTIKNGLLQQVTGIVTPAGAYRSVRIGQNETLKELQKQLTSLDVVIVDTRSRLGDQHPELLALLQKRDELRVLYTQQFSQVAPGGQPTSPGSIASNPLSQDLASQYIADGIGQKALEGRLRVVQADLARLRSSVVNVPTYKRSLLGLTREREGAETAYKLLNTKLEEARIAEGQVLSNIRVVELATLPTDPVSPKPLAIAAISTIAGLILAGAMVLLLELMDSSLRTEAEAEAVLNLPVLGTLPRLRAPTSSMTELERFLDHPNQVEPYRALLKALESSSDSKSQVFVLSSVTDGEGKASVVLHLAAVAALLSRRTLVIDADLRHPLYHHLLNIPACPGLAEVVNDKLPFLEAVQTTPIQNLFVLPCGQALHRPSALIETAAMTHLLAEVVHHYDCVIINASPLDLCADAATLSQASDGLVMVIRPNSTKRDQALRAIAELRKSNLAPIGVVLNETVLSLEKESPILPVAGEYKPLPASLHPIPTQTRHG